MTADQLRIIAISNELDATSDRVRILRNIAWPSYTKRLFFENNAQKLPEITYPPFDAAPIIERLNHTRKKIGRNDVVDDWAATISNKIEGSALLLQSRGTSDFHKYSAELYGIPKGLIADTDTTALHLANHFNHLFDGVKSMDLGAPPEACILASALADDMRTAVNTMFGDLAPEVVMDATMASNALAGRRRISIRPTACFTDNDIKQLIEHEAYIHVATSINGNLQPHIKILGAAHAGTTRTQEGLAVFAEFITGCVDLDRVRRLADRVIAIQMAIDGANFIDVYRYYLEKTDNQEQSFENAKRVFRGGVMTGGAPFTKDLVYLQGLIMVHNFLKVAVSHGKINYLDLLFCGKLDITDMPAIKQLSEMGLVNEAKFCPDWIKDKRYLLTYLSYSTFMGGMNMDTLSKHYEKMLV